MDTSVFFSWQSDTPSEHGREFLRSALDAATRRVAADLELPHRLELDHDTRGVPGTPAMVAAILEKIDNCATFVADVTLSHHSKTNSERVSPNPTSYWNLVTRYGASDMDAS
jgi:hypothetical protein